VDDCVAVSAVFAESYMGIGAGEPTLELGKERLLDALSELGVATEAGDRGCHVVCLW